MHVYFIESILKLDNKRRMWEYFLLYLIQCATNKISEVDKIECKGGRKASVAKDSTLRDVLSLTSSSSTFLHPKDDEFCSSLRNEMGMRRKEERLE